MRASVTNQADAATLASRQADAQAVALRQDDAQAVALQALAWTLGDGARADRLLALTGLDVDSLRARVGEPGLLAATLGFLENHEPDLIACAEALDIAPRALITARAELEA